MEVCKSEIPHEDTQPKSPRETNEIRSVLDLAMERMTFVWTIHKISSIRKFAQKATKNIFMRTPKYQNGNKWWLEIFPSWTDGSKESPKNGVSLLKICTDQPSESHGFFGCSFVAETSDGIEIPDTKQQKKFGKFDKSNDSDSVYSSEIGFLDENKNSSSIDSEDRLNIKCVIEVFSFVNDENLSPGISNLQPSQTLPSPLNVKLSKQIERCYVTDLETYPISFSWKIPNIGSLRKLAQDEVLSPMEPRLISPKYSYCDGMLGNREVGNFGFGKSSEQALWWLQLDPFSTTEKGNGNSTFTLHSEIKEGLFSTSVDFETSNGQRIGRLEKVFHHIQSYPAFYFGFCLEPDQISKLGSDDVLNVRCSIEIFRRILTIEEE